MTAPRPAPLLTFALPSDVAEVRGAVDRVAAVACALPLSTAQVDDLGQALAEALLNAIEHGNASRPRHPVAVTVRIDADGVVVAVTDGGTGLPDPATVGIPDVHAKLRGEGDLRGWGLFLIGRLVDDVRVVREPGRQTLELVVRCRVRGSG